VKYRLKWTAAITGCVNTPPGRTVHHGSFLAKSTFKSSEAQFKPPSAYTIKWFDANNKRIGRDKPALGGTTDAAHPSGTLLTTAASSGLFAPRSLSIQMVLHGIQHENLSNPFAFHGPGPHAVSGSVQFG
jgi:hypothetical protein